MITFNKIENADIFTRDFRPLVKNNTIEFPTNSEEIAVIYGPNGTGKTSLIKVLAKAKGTHVEFGYDGNLYTSGESVFHIINDQNNRNIIVGEAKDFFLGDNIRREFELQEFIASERTRIIGEIISLLKSKYGISAASSPLIELVSTSKIADIIRDIANNKSKGERYSTEDLIAEISLIKSVEIPEYDDAKLQFIKSDIIDKNSIIYKIEQLDQQSLSPNANIHEIEENTEAIAILSRFHKSQCIVCDTDNIDWQALLTAKTKNRTTVYEALDEDIKVLVERIIKLVPDTDPFQVKTLLIEAIDKGDKANINFLKTEFTVYKELYCYLVLNDLAEILSNSELPAKIAEYQTVLSGKPEITEEDMIYIQEIISNSMSKTLTLERDARKNLRIYLSNKEFLGKSRDDVPLSTGEQNFLSLTFEFLKAKNSSCPVVVIDDPVSSFDSIYKNKVAYAIVKILHHKKRIVLTHNTDLLRLLESQYKKCYKLYILNNADGEENGLIQLKYKEHDMLINLEKLLSAFRADIFMHIQNMELFLISMIPFMRGYSNIINDTEISHKLTQLMHGYKTETVDVAQIYITLFGNKDGKIPTSYTISVSDILNKNVGGVHILDNTQYPLLDKTLRHSFTYLSLRLMVEKALVMKFSINTNEKTQLGQIISAAYPDENDKAQIRNRIRLTSKKTLINEFNHFEGNLSIFQPAIDITDQALGKERTDIETFVSNL